MYKCPEIRLEISAIGPRIPETLGIRREIPGIRPENPEIRPKILPEIHET